MEGKRLFLFSSSLPVDDSQFNEPQYNITNESAKRFIRNYLNLPLCPSMDGVVDNIILFSQH
jgi:hypothetical protein